MSDAGQVLMSHCARLISRSCSWTSSDGEHLPLLPYLFAAVLPPHLLHEPNAVRDAAIGQQRKRPSPKEKPREDQGERFLFPASVESLKRKECCGHESYHEVEDDRLCHARLESRSLPLLYTSARWHLAPILLGHPLL